MTTTSWKSGVKGDFNIASNWTSGVPGAGDTALITVKGSYTVTDNGTNSIGILQMTKGATLVVNDSLDVASGTGTGALAGTIKVAAAGFFNIDGGNSENSGLIEEFASSSGALDLSDGTLSQTATGRLKIAGQQGILLDDSSTIDGGAISTAKNSSIFVKAGGAAIEAMTKPLANAGYIETDGGNLTISGAVKNAGTGNISAGDGTDITIDGAVTGGSADISGSGGIAFDGPSSAKVAFESSSSGTLFLGDATKFTGTVAGMSADPDASIDLANILYADGPEVDFDAAKHLLTVTDPTTGTIDKIKIVGSAGTFTAKPSPFATTLISDPSGNPASAPHANVQLLTQSMASLDAGSGTAAIAHHAGGESSVAPSETLAVDRHWHA